MSAEDCQDIITIEPSFTFFFWGGVHIPIYNLILSILPSEVCRTNTIITHFRNEEAEVQKLVSDLSRSKPGRTRIRSQIFISQPNTLINQRLVI